MLATITLYGNMAGQAGRFTARRLELERLFREIPGLVSFHLLETRDGLAVVLLGRGRAGCEAGRLALEGWIDAHVPHLAGRRPFVVEGEVIVEAPGATCPPAFAHDAARWPAAPAPRDPQT